MNGDTTASAIYLALLLAALGGWALVEYRARLGEMARVAAAWGLIFLAVAAGYGLWGDLRSKILPAQQVSAQTVTVPRAQDGHYYLDLQINGQPITLLADTGASGIVLSKSDALDLGIELSNLRFLGKANTANGVVRTARVSLDQIKFGPFVDTAFPAFVSNGDMEGSLLGMEYLSQFSMKFVGEEMTLGRAN